MKTRKPKKEPLRRAQKVSVSLRKDSLDEAKETAVKRGYAFSFSAYIQALIEADLDRQRKSEKRRKISPEQNKNN